MASPLDRRSASNLSSQEATPVISILLVSYLSFILLQTTTFSAVSPVCNTFAIEAGFAAWPRELN